MIRSVKETEVSLKRIPSFNPIYRFTWLQWLLLILPMLYILLLLVYSISGFFKLSVYNNEGFTLEYIAHMFTTPVYLKVLVTTFKIAFLVTVTSLLLGYPVAYLLTKVESSRWKRIILMGVLIPFWISLLVRTFSWMVLLQDSGIINTLLMQIGFIDKPLPLLYNTFAVVVGMTHVLLPYMILSLYSIMEGIDQNLVNAAQSMGASPLKAFFQVFFPLSLPGVLAGSFLVFIQGVGYFVTPALLGGPKNMMLSLLIQNNVSVTLNWHLASALAVLLFVVMLLLIFLAVWILRNNSILKEEI